MIHLIRFIGKFSATFRRRYYRKHGGCSLWGYVQFIKDTR